MSCQFLLVLSSDIRIFTIRPCLISFSFPSSPMVQWILLPEWRSYMGMEGYEDQVPGRVLFVLDLDIRDERTQQLWPLSLRRPLICITAALWSLSVTFHSTSVSMCSATNTWSREEVQPFDGFFLHVLVRGLFLRSPTKLSGGIIILKSPHTTMFDIWCLAHNLICLMSSFSSFSCLSLMFALVSRCTLQTMRFLSSNLTIMIYMYFVFFRQKWYFLVQILIRLPSEFVVKPFPSLTLDMYWPSWMQVISDG